LRGSFSNIYIYFKYFKKRVITATIDQGLYIVTNVDKLLAEAVLASTEVDQETDIKESISNIVVPVQQRTGSNSNRVYKESKEILARYLLWYRRFAYLGPDIIRNLYKVTILNKPIRILSNRRVYKVC